jgi:RNA polymerase sigma-70 factor (ECF subfamily)
MDDPLDGLAERVARGDRDALAEQLARLQPELRAFIRLRAGKVILARESCSDLAQSVCREILAHLDRFEYPGEKAFKQWLFRTALRKLGHRYDHWQAARRDARRERPVDRQTQATQDQETLQCYRTFCTPSAQAIAGEELQRIERAFEQLADDRREVIVLSRLMGLDHAEIARELGRSEAAVRSLLCRALAELAEQLARGT